MSDNGRTAAFHQLLLRTDSRLPDELVAEARRWLADGMLLDIAQAVVFTAMTSRIALSEVDVALLAETLAEAGADIDLLADIEVVTAEEMPLYGLAPVGPEVLAEHGELIPYNVDLTRTDAGPAGPDGVDAAITDAVSAMTGPAALWRCWRYPAMDTQWPPAKRMYLVHADHAVAEADLPDLAARLQNVLLAAGEADPLVTVFGDADTLPMFQRTALGFAALLWTARAQPEIRIARSYDPAQAPHGDDTRLPDDGERERMLGYLDQGVPLVITTTMLDDLVDPARGAAVPTNFRTDGTWVWSDAVRYYLDQHRLAPDHDFLAHVRARGYAVPEIDVVSLHRALAAVQRVPVTEFDGDPLPAASG
ncbi:hypothetical protein ACI2K4_02710 [Micromonospora sp. NPDC050397]|uniref:hypothetical protein n=1 Tax=Micromonospora sp. NPDC050397 TaxID=3364279 RepID=UPI00384C2553